MSCFFIQGFFATQAPVRESAPPARNSTHDQPAAASYCVYQTTIRCAADGSLIPATLRVFTPITAQPFPDYTIVYCVAKAAFNPSGPVILDVLSGTCHEVPGNPSDDRYEDSVPALDFPIVFGTGNIPSSGIVIQPPNTQLPAVKAFDINTSAYVRGALQSFVILGSYDNASRWVRTQAPRAQSAIAFLAQCHSYSNGKLRVSIEDITFNVGPHIVIPTASNDTSPPGKRRRFAAGPPSTSPVVVHPAPPYSSSSTSLHMPSQPIAGPSNSQPTDPAVTFSPPANSPVATPYRMQGVTAPSQPLANPFNTRHVNPAAPSPSVPQFNTNMPGLYTMPPDAPQLLASPAPAPQTPASATLSAFNMGPSPHVVQSRPDPAPFAPTPISPATDALSDGPTTPPSSNHPSPARPSTRGRGKSARGGK